MKIEVDRKLLESVMILGSVVEARDPYTGGHLWRVAQLAKALGEKAGLSGANLFLVTLGGYLHDVGKTGVSDSVLLKKGSLNDNEFAVIKTHPLIGRDMLKEHPLAPLVEDVVLHHHERCDGRGYPEGKCCGELSMSARIIGLVDAFDAMTSTRSYRKGMPIEKAVRKLEQEKGGHFDASLVDHFVHLSNTRTLDHIVGHSDFGRPLVECPMCGPVIAIPRSKGNGDTAHCKVCTGRFRLHQNRTGFEAEFLAEHGTAAQVRPEPETEPIADVVNQAPREVEIT